MYVPPDSESHPADIHGLFIKLLCGFSGSQPGLMPPEPPVVTSPLELAVSVRMKFRISRTFLTA